MNKKDFTPKGNWISLLFWLIFVWSLLCTEIISWNKVLAPIWNSEDVPASVLLSGRLREKDKALIKEKFSVRFPNLKIV